MPQLAIETYLPQLVWLAITFIGLYLVMARVVVPRIASVLEERQGKIQHDLDKAEELKAETDKAIAEYEAALAAARDKAGGIVAEMRAQMTAEADQRKATADAEVTARTAAAEAQVAQARDQAMAGLTGVASEAASAVIERLIGGRPAATEVEGAVAQALAGLR